MERLKNYCKASGSSLVESVMALSIISICLYISMMVYAQAFTPKSSASHFASSNKIDEAFFLMQIAQDSILEKYNQPQWLVEEEDYGTKLKKITIQYKDSSQVSQAKSYYVNINE